MPRAPAVAGNFYDAEASGLRACVEAHLEHARGAEPCAALGILAPHAAYAYSGAVAARVYSRVVIPDTVIVLGPNHTGLGQTASVSTDGPWAVPTGDVAIDGDLASHLLNSCEDLSPDELAHSTEHGVEVQLPFLLARNPAVRVVPICLRTMSFQMCECIGKALGQARQLSAHLPYLGLEGPKDCPHFSLS